MTLLIQGIIHFRNQDILLKIPLIYPTPLLNPKGFLNSGNARAGIRGNRATRRACNEVARAPPQPWTSAIGGRIQMQVRWNKKWR
jgi:hypothetical protein